MYSMQWSRANAKISAKDEDEPANQPMVVKMKL